MPLQEGQIPLTAQDVADAINTIGFTKDGLVLGLAITGLNAQISACQTQILSERAAQQAAHQEAEVRIQALQGQVESFQARQKALVAGDLSAA